MHHILCMQESAKRKEGSSEGRSTLGVRTTQCKRLEQLNKFHMVS